jgi:hypothetical protein
MATTTPQTFRVFVNHYLCEACPNEFSEEMPVVTHSWCPCCEARCEPYDYETLLEDAAEEDV